MFIRTQNKTTIDYGKELWVTILKGDKCSKDTLEARNNLIELMQAIVQDPSLIISDNKTPESIKYEHNGEMWVIKVSVVKEVVNAQAQETVGPK